MAKLYLAVVNFLHGSFSYMRGRAMSRRVHQQGCTWKVKLRIEEKLAKAERSSVVLKLDLKKECKHSHFASRDHGGAERRHSPARSTLLCSPEHVMR